MAELDTALVNLDADISTLGFPKEDTVEWWRLRALSTGASLLRTIQSRNLTAVQADTFRKGVRVGMMRSDTADVIEVAQAAEQAAIAKPAQVVP